MKCREQAFRQRRPNVEWSVLDRESAAVGDFVERSMTRDSIRQATFSLFDLVALIPYEFIGLCDAPHEAIKRGNSCIDANFQYGCGGALVKKAFDGMKLIYTLSNVRRKQEIEPANDTDRHGFECEPRRVQLSTDALKVFEPLCKFLLGCSLVCTRLRQLLCAEARRYSGRISRGEHGGPGYIQFVLRNAVAPHQIDQTRLHHADRVPMRGCFRCPINFLFETSNTLRINRRPNRGPRGRDRSDCRSPLRALSPGHPGRNRLPIQYYQKQNRQRPKERHGRDRELESREGRPNEPFSDGGLASMQVFFHGERP